MYNFFLKKEKNMKLFNLIKAYPILADLASKHYKNFAVAMSIAELKKRSL